VKTYFAVATIDKVSQNSSLKHLVSAAVLLVAYGLPMQPRFHRVKLSANASEQEEVALPAAGRVLAPTQMPEKEKRRSPKAKAIETDDIGPAVRAR
jgi:hypothetical protein